MLPRLINYDDAISKFTWEGAVDSLRKGHFLPAADIGDIFLGPANETLLTRAAYIAGLGHGVKAATIRDANAAQGIPTVHSTMILFDADFARPKAIIDGKLVTEIKTASDSILGAKLLARKNSKNLLIVGSGTVAASLVRAYSSFFPDLENISLWSRRPETALALAASFQNSGTQVTAVPDLQAAVAQADIISSATTARSPVLKGAWIRPGTHVDLIGAFKSDMREADDELISSSSLYVDSRSTTIGHIGEIAIPMAAGLISEASILGDLYDLVPMKDDARKSSDEITVFKNGGGAHLDLMIAAYLSSVVDGN